MSTFKVLMIEDSASDLVRIAKALRRLDVDVTCISGIHEMLAGGQIAPCSEYGPAAWDHTKHLFAHDPLRLTDYAIVLLDGAPDGTFKGWDLLQHPDVQGMLPPVVGISNSKGSNEQMCRAGAVGWHDKAQTEEIVTTVIRLLAECQAAQSCPAT